MEKVGYGRGAWFVMTLIRRPCQFDLASITSKLADLDEESEVPKIKLGDASCSAPFTSKLSNVAAGEVDAGFTLRPSSHPHPL